MDGSENDHNEEVPSTRVLCLTTAGTHSPTEGFGGQMPQCLSEGGEAGELVHLLFRQLLRWLGEQQ